MTPQHPLVEPPLDLPRLEALCRELADDLAVPQTAHRRRSRGVVFTPKALAHYLCEEVLRPFVHCGRRITVLDPAAGDGSLLAAAAAVLGDGHRLIGLERDPELAAQLSHRLPSAEVHVCEALLASPPLPGVDAVVANPPYVRSIHLRNAEPALWAALAGSFAATSHGEWDLYTAFLERAPSWLRDGGRFGFLVPSRWLIAENARELRAHLAKLGCVRSIIDFGDEQLFRGATTYASIVIGQRSPPSSATVPTARRGNRQWETGHIAAASFGAAPWVSPTAESACFSRWHGRGPTLGEVAQIAKGAGSNADRVFVIEAAHLDGDVVHGQIAGEQVTVEAGMTVSLARGRDVRPWSEGGGAVRAVFPYAAPYRARDLLPLPLLRAQFPRAAAHLERARATLSARERGRFRGELFYAWGRPQNLAFHLDAEPKVIVPDVVNVPRAALDASGQLVLDSAYAIRPRLGSPFSVEVLWVLLNATWLRGWLNHRSVPLRGGYTRIKTAVVAPMPLPVPGDWTAQITRAVRCGEPLEAVELLADAYRG